MTMNPLEAYRTSYCEAERTLAGGPQKCQQSEIIIVLLYGAGILACGILLHFFPRRMMFLVLPILLNWLLAPALMISIVISTLQSKLSLTLGIALVAWTVSCSAFTWWLVGETILYIT